MLRTYWKIEYINCEDNSHVSCFSPKYYGNYKECKQWVRNHALLSWFNLQINLRLKITFQVEGRRDDTNVCYI